MKTYKVLTCLILFALLYGTFCALEYLVPYSGFGFTGVLCMLLAIFLVESSYRLAKDDLLIADVEEEKQILAQIDQLKKRIISANEEDKEFLLNKLYKLRHHLYDLVLRRVEPA